MRNVSKGNQEDLKWFAAKSISDRAYVLKYLEIEHIEIARISDIPNLIFIHCTRQQIVKYRYEMFDKLYIYRNPDRTEPEPIPNRVMKTFLLMAPYHDEPVMYLSIDDPHFFDGPKKRVIKGVFAGCEGIIKRIKGERRLIVKISAKSAIATPYIPKDYIEDINS